MKASRPTILEPGYVKLGWLHCGWITFEGNLHFSLAWIRA